MGQTASGESPSAGTSLKAEHYEDVLCLPTAGSNSLSDALWFEVHTENYFVPGGPRLDYLHAIRQRHDISFHGVGASLGSPGFPTKEHLNQVKRLIDRFEPCQVSEHAVWSRTEQNYFADLLPLLRTREVLNQLVDGVDNYQAAIGRPMLLENPSNYLNFVSEMDEPEFLVEVAKRTGCGLLVDVNNLYISSRNTGINAADYLSRIPADLVGEIHIAGHEPDPQFGSGMLIDSHATEVSSPVWALLDQALVLYGPKPVLLERDGNIPSFSTLLIERDLAQEYLSLERPITSHGSVV